MTLKKGAKTISFVDNPKLAEAVIESSTKGAKVSVPPGLPKDSGKIKSSSILILAAYLEM